MIVRGGLVALPGRPEPIAADILVTDGRISGIVAPGTGTDKSDETIDAGGLLVLPGAIDPHVHFDDPGYTDREDFAHGTAAAASGGVTMIVDMPSTAVPPVTSSANLHKKLEVVSGKALIDFGFFGGVSGQVFEAGVREAMRGLATDVLGFKCYFVSGMDTFDSLNHFQFLEVLRIAAELGRPVLLHAEDRSFVDGATAEVRATGGDDPADYHRSRPDIAEILAVGSAAELARIAWADREPEWPPVHIVHVSTGRAAEIIGSTHLLSGETGPQYLGFSLEDFERIGSALKVTPPPKPLPNAMRLWDAIVNGQLDFAASDHAPAPTEQKATGSIWTDYAGIPGTGTLLPYLFSEGYLGGRLTLGRLLEITSGAAAHRYGLEGKKGSIRIGNDADFVFIDPEAQWIVRGSEFLSKGKITPLEGVSLSGKVIQTIVRGRTVYDADRGIVADQGSGEFVRRSQHSKGNE